jgi:hypothetical protein
MNIFKKNIERAATHPHPPFPIWSYAISELCNFKKVQEIVYPRFLNARHFFCAGISAQWDEGGGRILLDDNTGVEAIMLRSKRCQCFGVWIQSGLPCVYMHSWTVCSQFQVAQNLTCVEHSRTTSLRHCNIYTTQTVCFLVVWTPVSRMATLDCRAVAGLLRKFILGLRVTAGSCA